MVEGERREGKKKNESKQIVGNDRERKRRQPRGKYKMKKGTEEMRIGEESQQE